MCVLVLVLTGLVCIAAQGGRGVHIPWSSSTSVLRAASSSVSPQVSPTVLAHDFSECSANQYDENGKIDSGIHRSTENWVTYVSLITLFADFEQIVYTQCWPSACFLL